MLTQNMSIPLSGSFSDDALTQSTTVSWQQLSGPGLTTFINGDKPGAIAVVTAPGAYVYRLIIDDGEVRTFDDVSVTATSPIYNWRVVEFGANAMNSAISGDLADPDGDGMKNLLEYGLHSDPESSEPSLVTMDTTATHHRLTYVRLVNAPDISYQVQWSDDLKIWQNTGVTEQILGSNGVEQTVRAQLPITPGEQRLFMRVLVTRF
jgi:hypothetical protein